MSKTPRALILLLSVLGIGLTACDRDARIAVEAGVSAELARDRAERLSDIHYRLTLDIPREQSEDISAAITIDFELATADTPLQVDFRADAERLHSLSVNGNSAEIRFIDEHVLIGADLLRVGHNTLAFEFLAGNSSLNRNPDFLYTLFVPDRARTAFPVFDQPDLKANWSLTLSLPADWNALSAGPLERREIDSERQTLHFADAGPISTYAFSFVAGAFETVTRDIGGRSMTILHREPDAAKVERNLDAVFQLHGDALAWLEEYTGIPLPYAKLDIALIPAHPYGGMEHVGAIQYRADSLFLDEGAAQARLLGRASLIAHEVAHMWFGNLVTMRWFDDVWTKEVFANFMAAKIVNPSFPDIDHELDFLIDHHPGAYSIDRSEGANAIRQPLANLNQAGQLYGPIIYDKAPIMMRQLERLLGEDRFREGMREYLQTFSHANASWPELIAMLDARSDEDVAAWSEVWVNTPGRPHFSLDDADGGTLELVQSDPAGLGRLWPQSFTVLAEGSDTATRLEMRTPRIALGDMGVTDGEAAVFNADGFGYGLFPASIERLDDWRSMAPLHLASLLIGLYEQMLETGLPSPQTYFPRLLEIAGTSDDQLLLDLALAQLQRIYWTLIPDARRVSLSPTVERTLWRALDKAEDPSLRKLYFKAVASMSLTPQGVARVSQVWSGEQVIEHLPLAENDYIDLAIDLAIKRPKNAEALLSEQRARTKNPDQLRRLEYLAPALSADPAAHDAFFASLSDEGKRATESWTLDALGILHHPMRVRSSEAYLLPSLELLEEIQATGDIFFPAGWLRTTFRNHHSDVAVATVRGFLEARPDYNAQLRMKILQAADPLLRANRLRGSG
ncbi:MAG: M1 family aminopeptidase [Halieaceae bacterium]|jgi:aminopeptidase N|nr:M1 family aminopeptidase [Halieaceae bacterium]